MRLYFCALLMIAVMGASSAGRAADFSRIAFGSCGHQSKPQPIWSEIARDAPDLFIFLGDNIYGDFLDDPAVLAKKYRQLASKPGFASFRETTPVVGTWDDHDYGRNDAGREYEFKEASREVTLDFFEEPATSERRSRPDGIYTSYLYGEPGKRLQVILLDLRWNRSELVAVTDRAEWRRRRSADMGPYLPNDAVDAELLGEAQWQWLEDQLEVDADLRLIGSSLQLLPEFSGWESWANFPRERERFIALLNQKQKEPVVILSGDVHWSEFSRIDQPARPWPLVELTSSGLTEEWKRISPNKHRVGKAFAVANYGLVDIDWTQPYPEVTLTIKDEGGEVLLSEVLSFPRVSDTATTR